MLSKDSMVSFKNPNDYFKFLEELKIPKSWRIETGLLNGRGKMIEEKSYVSKLRKVFNSKKLFRRNVSVAEIVSWLDGFVIIARTLRELKKSIDKEQFLSLKIYLEYRIEMSKNRRIDYIFEYRNQLLLIEMRLSDRFPNISNVWQKKEIELIIYKELLSNYLSSKFNIIIYALVYMPEYDRNNLLLKNNKYNTDNIGHLSRYIQKYLLKL